MTTITYHVRLNTAIFEISGINAPDPKPSSVEQFDADTDSLDALKQYLATAMAIVEELQRHRGIEREDLVHDLRVRAVEEGMTAEEMHGVGGQFSVR